MTIDVTRAIGAITRQVSSRDYDGKPARVVIATRVYDTDREDLWDALTNAERIPRWFMPISGELELGGRYQLEGNAGGTIEQCEPPRYLAVTWEMRGDVTWVRVELSEHADGKTMLRLEHIAHIPDPDKFWERYGPGAVGVGWDGALLGLDQYMSGAPAVTPETAMVWLASDEGKAFLTRSSDAWCAASIEFGTDEAAARASAERTRAFYTGEGG